MSTNKSLMARDLKHLWHPCTQMSDHERYPIIPIKKGEGVYLHDFDGNAYIDAISSWWTNILGHGNTHIKQAIKDQLDQLEHVIFAGFSHEPAVELGEKLAAITPGQLNKVFFGENGSSAIEIALKMSFHYWRNKDKPNKTKFVALKNGYHGETLGALAVGDVALFKETYAPLIMESILVTSPDCYFREEGESWEDYSLRQFDYMEHMLSMRHEEISAVIIEPLVQCATGMRMYHPIYLKKLRDACDKYQVHLIADEIAVGFGRTGKMFACDHADITPDFMCLSKALTSGFLALSAVMTTDPIFDAFYDSYESMRGFLHSHSYTGNPLACRAACATLDLLQKEKWLAKNVHTAKMMWDSLAHLQDHPNVAELRQTGMIIALEVVKDKKSRESFDWRERRGLRLYEFAQKNGALIRPIGNVIYLMPPYTISEQQLQHLANVVTNGLVHVVAS